jgi:hypothetical protein
MGSENNDSYFDELLSGALRTYGTVAPQGIAGRVLARVDAAQQTRQPVWRRLGLPAAVLAAAAALVLAAWLHTPRSAPTLPSVASNLPVATPATVPEPVALPKERASLDLPHRSVRHAAAPDHRSRPLPIVPEPMEQQQLALMLLHQKDGAMADQPNQPAAIVPIEIKPIEIQPIQIAGISQ